MKMIGGRITEYFGKHKLTVENLTGDELNDFYAWLKGKGLTGASALHYHSLIHTAMKYAVKKEYLDDNPCDHADRPKQEHYRASFYSEADVRELLAAAKGSTIYIPVMLAAFFERVIAFLVRIVRISALDVEYLVYHHKTLSRNCREIVFIVLNFDRFKKISAKMSLIQDLE